MVSSLFLAVYLDTIQKATDEDIVVEHTNMYEQFFVRTGEKKAKVTLTFVPYFEGDYFSRRAEYIIANIDKEDAEKRQKSGKDHLQKLLRNIQPKLLLQMILQRKHS
ncbi:hypothetical protein AMTR_s00051p00199200 [Amborella trichopoda]|uniref:histone acetyltransferase n=1 Tax=Amborella trichopoda TaxID=13333 RepID=U5CTR9_AMBTC|nr:hypothetical protein AMTR_s00051p00199200 [Amborella trichopoda]